MLNPSILTISKSTDMWIRGQLRSQEIILLNFYEISICYNLVNAIELIYLIIIMILSSSGPGPGQVRVR